MNPAVIELIKLALPYVTRIAIEAGKEVIELTREDLNDPEALRAKLAAAKLEGFPELAFKSTAGGC